MTPDALTTADAVLRIARTNLLTAFKMCAVRKGTVGDLWIAGRKYLDAARAHDITYADVYSFENNAI